MSESQTCIKKQLREELSSLYTEIKNPVFLVCFLLWLVVAGVAIITVKYAFQVIIGFFIFAIGSIVTILMTPNRDGHFPKNREKKVASIGIVLVFVVMLSGFVVRILVSILFPAIVFQYEWISEFVWFIVILSGILYLISKDATIFPLREKITRQDILGALTVSLAITPFVLLIVYPGYVLLASRGIIVLASQLLYYFVLMFFLVALPEEYAFREVLQGGFRTVLEKKPPVIPLFLASVIFGAIHIPLFLDDGWIIALSVPFAYQGLIGALYGTLWQRTGKLLPAAFVHAWFDMIIFASPF